MQGQFLLDTGAYGAMIDLAVAQSLELAPQGLRQIHGIHGYGRLELYIGRRALPAHDGEGHRKDYVTDIECVAVPGLCAKNREQGVEIVGILGRQFLGGAHLTIDGAVGAVNLVLPEREHPLSAKI
jgi:hypothetical protein